VATDYTPRQWQYLDFICYYTVRQRAFGALVSRLKESLAKDVPGSLELESASR
jgi:hypothetical protein